MKKHTPGPWRFTDNCDGRARGYIRVVNENPQNKSETNRGVMALAQMCTARTDWRENATLMTAAPELFEQLERFHDGLPGIHGPYRISPLASCGGCQALAKAEGISL